MQMSSFINKMSTHRQKYNFNIILKTHVKDSFAITFFSNYFYYSCSIITLLFIALILFVLLLLFFSHGVAF